MAEDSRAKSVLGGKKEHKDQKKKSSKKPHSIHVRKGASGGYIATHHFKSKDGMSPDSEDHVLQDMDQLKDHMEDNLPEESEQGEPQPQPQQAPQPGMQM